MAVANEINKNLKRNNDRILIGSIAPDLSKILGEGKKTSHFIIPGDENIPDMDKFISKYKNNLDDDFVMGYFIHLYTDYLWFKYFIPSIYDNDKNIITKLDGTTIKCNGEMFCQYIYNDYTNLNTELLDEYDMDLKIFYNELPEFKNIIKEIDYDKLNLLIAKASVIIENSKLRKDLTFNVDNIKVFIKTSVELILAKLNEIEE